MGTFKEILFNGELHRADLATDDGGSTWYVEVFEKWDSKRNEFVECVVPTDKHDHIMDLCCLYNGGIY